MSVRLFAALELPREAREALVAWRPRDPALRPVPEESLHVTLAFLGWRDEADVPRAAAALDAAARPVGRLTVGAGLWLPTRRPRVLAVELVPGSAVADLQAAVAKALAAALGWEPERRAFLPHVTVARVRARPSSPALPDPPALEFAAPAVTLYRSHLSSRGARYEALHRVEL